MNLTQTPELFKSTWWNFLYLDDGDGEMYRRFSMEVCIENLQERKNPTGKPSGARGDRTIR